MQAIGHDSNNALRLHLLVIAFYLLAAVIITYPLVTVLGTRFAGFGYSDAYETAHHIWWFKYAIQHGQPLFYQTMLGYPDGIEGVTVWAHPLQFFPAWLLAFVLPLALASNLVLLATMALNGWALFLLARRLTGHTAAALLAGLAFMAFPTMQGHLGAAHAGLMVQWTFVLYVYALLRLREIPVMEAGARRAAARWTIATALLLVISCWGHTLQVVYAVVPVTALFALALLVRREWRALARVVAASVLGLALLGIFLIPIARATLATPALTDEGGSVRYSADLLAPVTPSFFHPLYGQMEYTHRVLGINLDEGYAYLGILPALLALVAVWKQPASRWWLLVAVAAYGLSLGPLLKVGDAPLRVTIGGYETYLALPWAALEGLPLLNLARTPGRFNFALALAVAVIAGYGAVWLLSRRFMTRRLVRWVVLGAAMAFILYDYQAFWMPPGAGIALPQLPTVTANVPDEIAALRQRDEVRAVFDVPWDHLVAAKEALFLQTAHERALIAGHATRRTPVDPAKLTLLETTFDPVLLNEAGADIVIVHREHDADDRLFDAARAALGEPLYAGERFALFETPDGDAAPRFHALPATTGRVASRADSYVYAPRAGWALLTAGLSADGRDAALALDNAVIQRWTVDGENHIAVPLLLSAGYHTLALSVDPPCPPVDDPALRCRTLDISQLAIGDYVPGDTGASAAFEPGVRLDGSRIVNETQAGDGVTVWLAWAFEQARAETDIHFVHVVDDTGNLVAQDDRTLGSPPAGSAWAEAVTIPLPADLAPGTYRVYAGWYTYPDFTRFAVLPGASETDDNRVLLGRFALD